MSDSKEWACPEEVWEKVEQCNKHWKMVWVLEGKEQEVSLLG